MLNNVFNENCGALLADGRIAFGSSNGIVVITPSVYDADEKMKGVDADEVCVNRQPLRCSIRYVVASWWESPWAKGLIAAFVFIGVCRMEFIDGYVESVLQKLEPPYSY